jgi:multimeric flavodoxin WrbA
MRLAVIDASPVGGGPVTRALAAAAAEVPDATILRMRTFDLFGRVCTTCMACSRTGRCSRHVAALDEALAGLAGADALLVGTSGHLHASDVRCRALLERLVGAFGHVEVARGLAGPAPAPARHKRAGLVCAAPRLLGVPATLGMLPAGVSSVWRVLDRAGADVVGCTIVGTRWAGPSTWDGAGEPARRLGRQLCAQAIRHPHGAGSPAGARIPAVPAARPA